MIFDDDAIEEAARHIDPMTIVIVLILFVVGLAFVLLV